MCSPLCISAPAWCFVLQVGGKYSLTLSESSWEPNAGVQVFVNGAAVGGITFISQGSWTSFVTSDPLVVTLKAGTSTLKVQESTRIGFNVAAIMLSPGAPPAMLKKAINAGDIMRLGSATAAAAYASTLVDLGVAWARSDFAWSEIEYSGPGQYQTAGHDLGVQALVARNIKVLVSRWAFATHACSMLLPALIQQPPTRQLSASQPDTRFLTERVDEHLRLDLLSPGHN